MHDKALKHLSSSDPFLAAVIDQIELQPLKPRKNPFQALVRSIISQQLSVRVAEVIYLRFVAIYGRRFPTPEEVLKTPTAKLRAIGLSGSKTQYIKNLAKFMIKHRNKFKKIKNLPDEEIITLLTEVKGIGRWTVEMFLIFSLGRDDVLSVTDLGIKNAIKKLYRLRKDPTPKKMFKIAKAWEPYRSHASRYLWKSLEIKKSQ